MNKCYKSTKDWPRIAKKRECVTATPIVFRRFPIFSRKKILVRLH